MVLDPDFGEDGGKREGASPRGSVVSEAGAGETSRRAPRRPSEGVSSALGS